MATQINKTSTAAQVISLCAIRRTRLKADHKGGFHEAPRGNTYIKHSKVQDDQPTPPSAA